MTCSFPRVPLALLSLWVECPFSAASPQLQTTLPGHFLARSSWRAGALSLLLTVFPAHRTCQFQHWIKGVCELSKGTWPKDLGIWSGRQGHWHHSNTPADLGALGHLWAKPTSIPTSRNRYGLLGCQALRWPWVHDSSIASTEPWTVFGALWRMTMCLWNKLITEYKLDLFLHTLSFLRRQSCVSFPF